MKHVLREENCLDCRHYGMADNNWCTAREHEPDLKTCRSFEKIRMHSGVELTDSFINLGV